MEALVTVLITAVFIVPLIVFAHQSGCHRWHSCPSDSGSYTCGDTGHCSSCPDNYYCKNGTYSPGSPVNTPISTPTPTTTPESTTESLYKPTSTPISESTPVPTLTTKPIPSPTPTATPKTENNVLSNVQNSQAAYHKNPHWFREKLIEDLAKEFGPQHLDIIARLVYTLLPDIKN